MAARRRRAAATTSIATTCRVHVRRDPLSAPRLAGLDEPPSPRSAFASFAAFAAQLLLTSQINIGTIGHVAHGKSSTVRAISGVQTVRFKNELERNITIKLGYANAKVRRRLGEAGDRGELDCARARVQPGLVSVVPASPCVPLSQPLTLADLQVPEPRMPSPHLLPLVPLVQGEQPQVREARL